MPDANDMDLVREFARDNSEAAFTELVRRHLNLVYSVARRCTGNDGDAHDVTQAVFIILARKAAGLREKTLLTGWLYETTRFAAARLLRTNARRHTREQEAYMQSTLTEADTAAVWEQLSPHLEAAMSKLAERDRALLVLRFYENKSGPETAALLGIRENAAHKRVARALEKLRKFFAQRGVILSGAAIAGAVSANSVQAAPVALVKTISAIAVAKGAAAGTSTLTLVKGALQIMAWTKMKTAIVASAIVLLAAGTTTMVVEKATHPKLSATDLSWADDPKYWKMDSRVIDKLPPVFILRPTHFPNGGGSMMFGGANGHYKRMGINVDEKWLVEVAYNGFSEQRCIFPLEMPDDHYDLMFTLPEDFQNRLKDEVKSRFGLTAHVERRTVDVLLLQVKIPDAPGLKNSDGSSQGWNSSQYWAKIHGQQISGLIDWLENSFDKPIINRTGLTKNYDMDLDWKPQAGQSETDALQQTLLNQLGLELVPSREPIEMLVVEKVK
jgi:uncharacterized protein (TIGR03435 family)